MLKCSDPEDILLRMSTVGKQWAAAGASTELWIELTSVFQFASSKPGYEEWAETFRRYYRLRKLKLIFPCTRHYWVFYCHSKTWRQVKLKYRTQVDGLFVLLPDESVFYCHASIWHAPVQQRLSVNAAQKLPPMIHKRQFPGGVHYRNKVYIFGGQEVGSDVPRSKMSMRSSEVFHLTTSQWEPLPDMIHPHCSFTVAIHSGLMYLCGGMTVHSEVFDPQAQTYRPLDFTLQSAQQGWTVVADGELIVVSGKEGQRGRIPQLKMRQDPKLSCIGNLASSVRGSDTHIFAVSRNNVYVHNLFTDRSLQRLPPNPELRPD